MLLMHASEPSLCHAPHSCFCTKVFSRPVLVCSGGGCCLASVRQRAPATVAGNTRCPADTPCILLNRLMCSIHVSVGFSFAELAWCTAGVLFSLSWFLSCGPQQLAPYWGPVLLTPAPERVPQNALVPEHVHCLAQTMIQV
jgi:hypothetical protein